MVVMGCYTRYKWRDMWHRPPFLKAQNRWGSWGCSPRNKWSFFNPILLNLQVIATRVLGFFLVNLPTKKGAPDLLILPGPKISGFYFTHLSCHLEYLKPPWFMKKEAENPELLLEIKPIASQQKMARQYFPSKKTRDFFQAKSQTKLAGPEASELWMLFFLGGFLNPGSHIWKGCTLPETNIAPKNGWLEYSFPFQIAHFQVLC